MSLMRARCLIFSVLLSLVALSATSFASTARRLSEDELITEADRVVTVTLKEPGKSAWDSEFKRIYTTYSFEVEEDLAGTGEKIIELVQPGGEVDDIVQQVDGFPTFSPGDRVVLFLRKTAAGYRVVGLSQGVFETQKNGGTEKLVQRLERLHLIGGQKTPLQIERSHLIQKIQNVWTKKKVR
jgi:hypothetical protein